MVKVIVGAILGALIVLIIAVIALDRDEPVKSEPKPMSKEQAVKRLQSIKPYYTYGGRTWTALDMAIQALGGEEEEE